MRLVEIGIVLLSAAGITTVLAARAASAPIERAPTFVATCDWEDREVIGDRRCYEGWLGSRRVAFLLSRERGELDVVGAELEPIASRVKVPDLRNLPGTQLLIEDGAAVDLDGDGLDELVVMRVVEHRVRMRVFALRGDRVVASEEARGQDLDTARRLLRGAMTPLR